MIEVWRPGRPEGRSPSGAASVVRRRGAAGRQRRQPAAASNQPQPRPAGETASPPPTAETPAAAELCRQRRDGRRGIAGGTLANIAMAEHRGEHRGDRPHRDRERPPVKRFERREKAPDPNSPFAKLAALKAQLEADAKERR